jgi:hypothetical protein
MQYLIALDPQLNLSAAEFVAAWNASDYASQGTGMVRQGDIVAPVTSPLRAQPGPAVSDRERRYNDESVQPTPRA